jgi:ABC-type multidrug transport system ATPase subunit
VALWGPNGAGKTTVIHCLLGLIPFEGQIVVAGKDVSTQGKAVRQAVGFVPQVLNFHHDLKVQETMEFYARLKKVPPDSIPALLARLGIQDQAAKRVGELSGGMKQRLALAISLLADPKILILDEPTSNLDIESRTELIGQLAALQAEGRTVLFSSHRLEEVIDLADRVVVLRQGQLVADCSVDSFFEESGLQARLALFVPKDRMAAALNALTVQGYTASPNGKRIWVEVASNRKGDPINTLAQAGIPVQDFQIELIEEGLPRDS